MKKYFQLRFDLLITEPVAVTHITAKYNILISQLLYANKYFRKNPININCTAIRSEEIRMLLLKPKRKYFEIRKAIPNNKKHIIADK